ncbi:hypothetical protein ABZP36_017417 [Zizania latifolia]
MKLSTLFLDGVACLIGPSSIGLRSALRRSSFRFTASEHTKRPKSSQLLGQQAISCGAERDARVRGAGELAVSPAANSTFPPPNSISSLQAPEAGSAPWLRSVSGRRRRGFRSGPLDRPSEPPDLRRRCSCRGPVSELPPPLTGVRRDGAITFHFHPKHQ